MVKYDNQTLIVRHIPNDLSKEDKIDFLKFFGAKEVVLVSRKSTKSSPVIAKFNSRTEAEAALKKLHQTEIFDQLLSVEFARGSDLERNINAEKGLLQNEVKEEQSIRKKYLDNFVQKINSWTNHLDFGQPPPVYYKYQYPPPTIQVLTNIAKVLATVPKFYTQVLHLMNKMNLPCPFIENFSVQSEIVNDSFHEQIIYNDITENRSEEESEIESDEDRVKEREVFNLKRSISKPLKGLKKRKLIKPLVPPPKHKPGLRAEDVFETEYIEIPKKIELKVSGDIKHLEEEKVDIVGEGFEKVMPIVQEPQPDPVEGPTFNGGKCITSEELAANRISSKDYHLLPVFKNYQAGIPSCRLYIKNLAKNVITEDLEYIYRRYILNVPEKEGMMFDIQLLQEGRMKGQAFVSLESVDQAKLALSETNGFILKGKPMVVQYARSSKPK